MDAVPAGKVRKYLRGEWTPKAKSVPHPLPVTSASPNSPVVASTPASAPSNSNSFGLPQPPSYQLELAKTGRSTCKRCDSVIKKLVLRVGTRPLFRGKPGYLQWQHATCTLFDPSTVKKGGDIEDYAKLSDEDKAIIDERIEISKEGFEDDNRPIKQEELARADFTGTIRPPPSLLVGTLLPYQREGHSWMVEQEVSDEEPLRRGGILADEMGMGKTIQTICCIVDNRPKNQHANEPVMPMLCMPVGSQPKADREEVRLDPSPTTTYAQ